MSHLVLCSACKRHVRVAEDRCPFCAAAIPAETRAAALHPTPPRGLSRAKVYAFNAALAAGVAAGTAAVAGCENENNNTSDAGARDGSATDGNAVAQGGNGGSNKGGNGGSGQGGTNGGRGGTPAMPYGCVFPCGDGSVKV
jgi:hypothetical protein